MKSSKRIAVAIAVLALLWIGSGFFTAGPVVQKTKKPMHEKPVMEVRVRTLKAEPFSGDVIVTGRSQGSRRVEVRTEIAGRVTEVTKEKGAVVKAKEKLAVLALRDLTARLTEAKERLAQRETEYNAARALELKGFNSRIKLSQAQADLEAARAVLKDVQIVLSQTKIAAPFEGVIYEQKVEIGDVVGAGSALFTLVDLDPVEFVAFVSERNIADIAMGGHAVAEFLDGSSVEGEITYIAAVANEQTRTFQVEVSVDNPGLSIKEGLTAKIRIPTQSRPAYKISPSVLTLDDSGQVGVKAVTKEGIVEFYPVTILSDTSGYMWVGGLPESLTLITVGQDFVQPGQHVKAVPAEGDGLL